MRAEILKELEEEKEEKKAILPKVLTHGQTTRKQELLAQLNIYANKFRTAKIKADEKKGAVSIATEALEKAEKEKKEAEKKKKDLEAQYVAVIAELKPLDG
ncbi:hypothetical protein V495_04936 [Pseudogymnoascus sp. VKM F-4514 (FW-929)]|nr:hypothetical protein V495_04936 [Pseudogymnoascus sp. VKM F-4514 (FW-929)]